MLPDRLGAALDETLHRMEEAQINVGSGKVRHKLVSHRLKAKPVRPRVPDQPRLRRVPVLPANTVSCPQGCGAQLNPRRIERHLRKVHPFRSILVHPKKDLTSRPPTPRKVGREYQSCSKCGVTVRVDHMGRHLKRVHASRPVRRHAVVALSSKDAQRESTSLTAPFDKNLDATKPYAHSYRELGRFGSHPSHDGFDDESTPD